SRGYGCTCSADLCIFFFFQAEDGIRDGHVTGVQTCALPICNQRAADGRGNAVERQHVGCGHDDVLGERPVAVHADDAGVLADVAVAGAALQAVAAHDVTFGRHELAGLEARHAVADRHDLARELVPHDHGWTDAAFRP